MGYKHENKVVGEALSFKKTGMIDFLMNRAVGKAHPANYFDGIVSLAHEFDRSLEERKDSVKFVQFQPYDLVVMGDEEFLNKCEGSDSLDDIGGTWYQFRFDFKTKDSGMECVEVVIEAIEPQFEQLYKVVTYYVRKVVKVEMSYAIPVDEEDSKYEDTAEEDADFDNAERCGDFDTDVIDTEVESDGITADEVRRRYEIENESFDKE